MTMLPAGQPVKVFGAVYRPLIWELLNHGVQEVNIRTGSIIAAGLYPISFSLDLGDRRFPVPGVRKVFPATAAAEVGWFLTGSQFPDGMGPAGHIWSKFKEDDGSVIGAYGHRWRYHFKRDQIGDAAEALRRDPTNRRIVVSAWDPGADGLTAVGQKNVPCPTHFSLSIVNNRLNMALFIRSSDVFVGLPYDVMGHAILMDAFARSINPSLRLGVLHVTLAHPHIYGQHFDMVRESLKTDLSFDWNTMPLPGLTLEMIESLGGRGLADMVRPNAQNVSWPPYCPSPEVVA